MPSSRLSVAVVLVLIVAGFIVYAQVISHEFINYDDNEYVFDNEMVRRGLTLDGFRWAFTSYHSANWHPLTWLSHMLDCQLFGLRPGWHLLTNAALHTLNGILLFFVLRRLTGSEVPAALVAALFALHPLHVESVAWVSERKDLLSGLFWILTLGAYARHAERPRLSAYSVVVLLFALGLMSKPMVVTLPCVLLLLDFWPLRRWKRVQSVGPNRPTEATPKYEPVSLRLLLLEKLPLFVLSAASSVVTVAAQRHDGAVQSLAVVSLRDRAANAVVAYFKYLSKTFVPTDLAILYPFSPQRYPLTTMEIVFAVAVVVLITFVSLAMVRRCPYLLVGWLWFVGTLAPVIGLVQVGAQAMADRYTYIPLIGLFIALAWAADDLASRVRWLKPLLAIAGCAAVLACAYVSRQQVRHWKDSVTVWEHALAVARENSTARINLGDAYLRKKRLNDAGEQFVRASQLNPGLKKPHDNLELTLALMDEAAKRHLADGRGEQAIAIGNHALDLARRINNADLIQQCEMRLQRYRNPPNPAPVGPSLK